MKEIIKEELDKECFERRKPRDLCVDGYQKHNAPFDCWLCKRNDSLAYRIATALEVKERR